jgi:aminoglycoside phosphotransferase (APT) family kinase protein
MMITETIPIREGEELEEQKIIPFIKKHLKDIPDDAPIQIKQFRAGRSNLTYLIQIGKWEAVLRRPPIGPVAPKAHDMVREYTILKEIHQYFPQAPTPYLLADESVIGRPFFLMERKKGIVLDEQMPENITPTKQLGRQLSQKMVDTLVQLHSIDYKNTKLVTMTKPEGFLERQVYGWIKRYELAKTEDIPQVERVKKWLTSNIPKPTEPTIIHYDFKLNNIMFDYKLNEIVGVFDWEMTTVGDPLADLGVAVSYIIEKNDSSLLKWPDEKGAITTMPGFMTRREFIESYAKKSGRDVEHMNFYLTFAFFKLAGIVQQIFYRYKKGQTKDERFRNMNQYVKNLLWYAAELTTNKF